MHLQSLETIATKLYKEFAAQITNNLYKDGQTDILTDRWMDGLIPVYLKNICFLGI